MSEHELSQHGVEDPRARLIGRLDALVASGDLDADMAARVRATSHPDVAAEAIRQVRASHARKRVEVAVERGRLSRSEADAVLELLSNGEDPDQIPGMHDAFRDRAWWPFSTRMLR